MNDKPQNLKIAINSLKLNEPIWKFVCISIVHRSIYLFKIVYPHDDWSYREITICDIDKIMFLKIFRNFLVVFHAAFKNYWDNRKMTSLKYHLNTIC